MTRRIHNAKATKLPYSKVEAAGIRLVVPSLRINEPIRLASGYHKDKKLAILAALDVEVVVDKP